MTSPIHPASALWSPAASSWTPTCPASSTNYTFTHRLHSFTPTNFLFKFFFSFIFCTALCSTLSCLTISVWHITLSIRCAFLPHICITSWWTEYTNIRLHFLIFVKANVTQIKQALNKSGRLDSRHDVISQKMFQEIKDPKHPLHYLLLPVKVSNSQMVLRPTYPYNFY